ncbi:MAG: hypothetical protein JKY86_02110 [Gammaproteobacteria bacterium]|nr:hypothetical protein [Gammaproteobacteria bacterium]
MMPQRDYHTIQESAIQIGCSEADIYHWISTNQIEAVVYTDQRQFIATTWNDEKEIWEGNGTVYYRGLLSVDSSWIKHLLDHKEIILITQAIPLEPNEYNDYSFQCPFKEEILPEEISAWEPYKFDDIVEVIQLSPFPAQIRNKYSSISDNLNNVLALINSKYSETVRNTDETDIPKYDFNYDFNGSYVIDDLRLTNVIVERLAKLADKDSSEVFGTTKTGKADLGPLPWSESKSKFSEINAIIERLFRDQGNKQCKTLWRELEKDISDELFRYDIHEIVTIGLDSLEWKNLSGNLSEMKYKTFCNKISAIRRFYLLKDLLINKQ